MITNYKNFDIQESKPSKRNISRIFREKTYMQTCNTVKDSKRLIDFCIENKVWK